MNWGGIPARKVTGEPLVIYCGVIDILQCYKTLKKLEHRFKAIIYDGKTVSGRDQKTSWLFYCSLLVVLLVFDRAKSS